MALSRSKGKILTRLAKIAGDGERQFCFALFMLFLHSVTEHERNFVRLSRKFRAYLNRLSTSAIPSRSHDAVIRVYDAAGNVVETHEHTGDFKMSAQALGSLTTVYFPEPPSINFAFRERFRCGARRRVELAVKLITDAAVRVNNFQFVDLA